MRILIIATQRTGGRNLNEWISKELKYTCIEEPNSGYVAGDNIVVKHLVHTILYEDMQPYNDFDPNDWDTVITLKRNDIRKAAESITFADKNNRFHSPYMITDEWIQDNESYIRENESFISKHNEIIDKIEYAGLKLTYEGIYETGEELPILKDYLGIKDTQYEYLLSIGGKMRKDILI
jgi:hypothetical protein